MHIAGGAQEAAASALLRLMPGRQPNADDTGGVREACLWGGGDQRILRRHILCAHIANHFWKPP